MKNISQSSEQYHEPLSKDYYWQAHNVCKLGQELAPQIISEMSDSVNQAIIDWLTSIGAPAQVIELFGNSTLLLLYDQQLAYGETLKPFQGADILSTFVNAGKNLQAVGGSFGIHAIAGTLPKYKLIEIVDNDVEV